jgi:hypothetical protein
MLLKTHVEKMSDYGLSIMLQKTSKIHASLHYIHENTSFIEIAERLGTGLTMDDGRFGG